MKHCLKILFATILISFSLQGFSAVNIVECEDEQGERSFRSACPPGTTQVGSKNVRTGSSSRDNDKSVIIKATLFSIPDCESCEEVKEFLQARGISFVEKNASVSIEIQQELITISGALKIPTTIIGEDVIVGYERSKLEEAYTKAGGVKPEPAADTEPTE